MDNVIVLFEVTLKEGCMEDYLNRASKLKDDLSKMDEFISAERFSSLNTKGKLLSMSIWKNEASVRQWRNFEMHRLSQMAGRKEDFADYKITVVTPVRTYTMNRREEAPEDSNDYFKV